MWIKRPKASKLFLTFLLSLALFTQFIPSLASAQEFELEAKAALLMDVGSGKIIFEKNMHEKLFPSSITKIMTMLLAMEALEEGKVSLDDEVVVSPLAASMGGSQIFLSEGDVVRFEDLLIGMIVGSGNDAAVAVAEHISGSVEAFVQMMNERARELGMENTNFVNPNGLHDDNHYTTAYDVSLMSRELLKYPKVHEWAVIWMDEHFLKDKIKAGEVYLSNTNRMVYYYKGCDGLKTGFTNEALHCISATARRGQTRFLAVIMAAPTSDIRYSEARRLLDYGFANFQSIPVAQKGEVVGTVRVNKGAVPEVPLVTKEPLNFLIPKGEKEDITRQVELKKRIEAPLAAGEVLGRLVALQEGKEIDSVDLITEEEVPRANFAVYFMRLLNYWIKFGK